MADLRAEDVRATDRWSDASTWTGDGISREVFFFPSGGVELYGSLYSAAKPSGRFGVVACGSWGVEADRTDPLLRSVAITAARLGGAGFVFHYPGYGDSYGNLATIDLADLTRAAADAVAEASRRCPNFAWALAGFMLGASVACLAVGQTRVGTLLLVQPALRPSDYFQRLTTTRRPLAPGPAPREMMQVGATAGMAYGYPIPQRIVDCAQQADAAVATAVAAFEGEGSIVRHPTSGEPDLAPPHFDRIEVEGSWRFGSQDHPALAQASSGWLERHLRETDRGIA